MNEQFGTLTPAERRVLRAALGRTNDQVATLLGISPRTVTTHVLSARRKLGGIPRGDAARLLHEHEAPTQKLPTPFLPMAEPEAIDETSVAAKDVLHDVRTPFLFVSEPEVAPVPRAEPDRRGKRDRILVMLIATSLILALLQYLPALRERAAEVGTGISPLLDRAGVKRSG